VGHDAEHFIARAARGLCFLTGLALGLVQPKPRKHARHARRENVQQTKVGRREPTSLARSDMQHADELVLESYRDGQQRRDSLLQLRMDHLLRRDVLDVVGRAGCGHFAGEAATNGDTQAGVEVDAVGVHHDQLLRAFVHQQDCRLIGLELRAEAMEQLLEHAFICAAREREIEHAANGGELLQRELGGRVRLFQLQALTLPLGDVAHEAGEDSPPFIVHELAERDLEWHFRAVLSEPGQGNP
jgi:hypothetical protein